MSKDKQIGHEEKKKLKESLSVLKKAVNKTKPDSITTEQAAELKRLSEELTESAKLIHPES